MTPGRIEVITGPMFSGKSEELIRRMRRAYIARQQIVAFKPSCDQRYSPGHISSHSRDRYEAIPVPDVISLWEKAFSPIHITARVVAIDEGQFFDDKLLDVCLALVERGARVIVSGLDTDFRGEPFTPMPELMAIADEVLKLSAICINCGQAANHTYRVDKNNQDLVSVGALGAYEARCRSCFKDTKGEESCKQMSMF